MMLHDINKNDVEMRQCEIWSHFFTNEFYLLGPDMLAKGKIHILPPRAGNSSPISVPEILSAWDHLRPRHWWIRRDSCGEFQCRARSRIHVGNLSLCFGSGCFLIYVYIYIYVYSMFPQIADWSMVYTCMCAVVEDLAGLIDQFLLSCCFQNCWGNLWVTGGFVGWIPSVGWMCDWTVFTKASCSWHGFSECSFTHSNHESLAAGRCRTPMATSITLRSWWKDWFEKLASNFQWEVLGPPFLGCNFCHLTGRSMVIPTQWSMWQGSHKDVHPFTFLIFLGRNMRSKHPWLYTVTLTSMIQKWKLFKTSNIFQSM